MRKVLSSSSEVFHFWANKVQTEGRAGNTSFDGDRLYSYRACIGRHIADGVVAISDAKYSVTTAAHQSGACAAARHLKIIRVSHPASINDSKSCAERNIRQLINLAAKARAKRDSYLADAIQEVKSFNTFAEALGSAERLEMPVTDPAALKRIADGIKQRDAEIKAALVERARFDALDAEQAIAEWRTGNPLHRNVTNLPVALRLNARGLIDTTHGAQIPAEDAKRLWPLILRTMRGERDYEVGMEVGHYRLTKIRRDGSLVIGCHDIAFAEIEGIAKQLNLIKEMEAA